MRNELINIHLQIVKICLPITVMAMHFQSRPKFQPTWFVFYTLKKNFTVMTQEPLRMLLSEETGGTWLWPG